MSVLGDDIEWCGDGPVRPSHLGPVVVEQLELVPGCRRRCAWCGRPVRPGKRTDTKFGSQSCRQASWRFHADAPSMRARADRPMRLAYLDPPYIDLAEEYYADHPDFDGEVDHVELLERACDEFPDGWALSCSARTLPAILQLRSCPADVRVAAWVRGERPTRSWRPLNAWEPVVWRGGRERLQPVEHRRLDAVVHTSRPRLTDPNRVVGAKPARFIWWLFELLGLLPGDELVDVFPGSGGVARAWSYVSGLTTVDA